MTTAAKELTRRESGGEAIAYLVRWWVTFTDLGSLLLETKINALGARKTLYIFDTMKWLKVD